MSHWWRWYRSPWTGKTVLQCLILFSTYSFADKDPLVNAMTGPELPLEFVSELSSKDESCNVQGKSNCSNKGYGTL